MNWNLKSPSTLLAIYSIGSIAKLQCLHFISFASEYFLWNKNKSNVFFIIVYPFNWKSRLENNSIEIQIAVKMNLSSQHITQRYITFCIIFIWNMNDWERKLAEFAEVAGRRWLLLYCSIYWKTIFTHFQ